MSRYLLQAFVIGLTIASGASAQCPGTAQPFGPDDSGLLTCNKDTSKCEQTVAGNVATTLVPGLIKCHSDQANLAFKGFPNSEGIGCEAPLIQKFLQKTENTQCPCINPTAIATFYESTLDATNS